MALPKQVQEQIKEAQQIAEALQQASSGEKQEAVKEHVDGLVATVEGEGEQPTEVQPEASTEAPPPEVAPESEKPKPERRDYKQMYNVLQGKYDAEVPILHRQIREQGAQLTQMRAQVTQLHFAPRPHRSK